MNSQLKLAPYEPALMPFPFVLLFSGVNGITSPSFRLSTQLFASSISCAFVTLLLCGGVFYWLMSKPKNEAAIQNSLVVSSFRRQIGYKRFAIWLLLEFWVYALAFTVIFWLINVVFTRAVPFWQCLLCEFVVANIVATGLFVQALALDRRYREKE